MGATIALGEALGQSLVGGLTIGLVGPLGAGKTQLVKGIASGNSDGDPRRVTSPTFGLVHEYSGRLDLYHVDVYRLRNSAELLALGFDELAAPSAAVVVEWADRVRAVMPDEAETAELMRLITRIKAGDAGAEVADGMRELAAALVARGAEVIIAGCTEIPLVLDADMVAVPLVSSTDALAKATVAMALSA